MARGLTNGEETIATSVFGSSIDFTLTRVHDEKYFYFQPDNSGMTPNGEIYVHGIYSADYSAEAGQRKGFFVHEMTHVWQYQIGVFSTSVIGAAIMEFVGRGGDYTSAYPYVLDASKDLTDYNLEQQAAIVEDYYRLTTLGLQPRRARAPYRRGCSPNHPPAWSRALYASVLRRFLSDPTYTPQPYRRVCAPN